MMALRIGELPAGDWIYEMKFDGYRALAFKAGPEVRLLSRFWGQLSRGRTAQAESGSSIQLSPERSSIVALIRFE
jgi:hypothetical protein